MLKRFLAHKGAMFTIGMILFISLIGFLAPILPLNDPYRVDYMHKFADPSWQFPFGADHQGRCMFSRMIWGIRPTLGLAFITMLGTIGIGALMGLVSGYFRGVIDEIIMRIVDIMLAFPSQIMVFAVVALFGIDVQNVILANVFIKWAWYARMIRTNVIKYNDRNFINYSKVIGNNRVFILFKHMLPSIASETAMLASLDMGWAIINISTLSFLGLGVQAPIPEWGAMLNEAKEVMMTNPIQMIVPGIAIVIVVALFNFLGDVLRDALDPKEVM